VISTYAKSGTTWMQQIIAQLLFAATRPRVAEMSPWLDLRVPPKDVKLPVVEAQTHRRFLKTHLPVDALRLLAAAQVPLHRRDGRDVVWSMYNHHANANRSGTRRSTTLPARRPADRAAARRRPAILARVDGATAIRSGHSGRTCAAGGEIRDASQRDVRPLHEPEARHAGQIRADRALPRHPDPRARWDAIVEPLLLFDWMKSNATKSVRSAARSGTPARRCSSTRA
jgi:aryl sulfotransferase